MPPDAASSGRSRWPRRLILALVLAALLAGGALGLQTEAAFQRVWLPLAGQALGGEWSATRGRLSLAGALDVEALQIEGPQLRGSVERGALRLRPLATLAAGRPVLERLEVAGARITLTETTAEPDDQEPVSQPPDESSTSTFDVEVERARLEDVELEIVRESGSIELGPLKVDVDSWAPFVRGHAVLDVPVKRRVEGEVALDLRLRADLRVQPVESPVDPLESASFAIDAQLEVAAQPSLRLGAVSASLEAEGFLAPGRYRLREGDLQLAEDGAPRFRMGATGELQPDLDVELRVDVEPLEGTARFGPLEQLAGLLDGGRVGGRVLLSDEADGWRVVPDLRLGPLGPTRPSAAGGTPPLAVALTGALRLRDGSLFLEPVTLDRLSVADEALGRLELRGLLREGATDLRAELTGLDLLPWLRAFGVSLADERHRLDVTGKLSLRDEDTQAIDGELALSLRGPETSDAAADGVQAAWTCIPELRGAANGLGGTIALHRRGGPEGRAEPLAAQITLVPPKGEGASAQRILVDAADVDLAPWAPLWEARVEPAAAEAAARPEREAPGEREAADGRGDQAEPDPGFELQVQIGRIALRELIVAGGELRARVEPQRFALDLAGVGVSGGLVDAALRREERGAGTEIDWTLRGSEIDVGAALAGVSQEGTAALEGILGIDSRGRGSGASFEEALDAAAGELAITLDDGRAEGLEAQQEVVAETGMPEFHIIDFGTLDVVYPIEQGRILVEQLRVDGRLVHLVATGEVGWRGLDLFVNPRLGPELAGAVPGRFAQSVVGTVTGALALPLVVRVEGPYGAVGVRTEPAAPALLGDLYSGVTGLVERVPGVAPGP